MLRSTYVGQPLLYVIRKLKFLNGRPGDAVAAGDTIT